MTNKIITKTVEEFMSGYTPGYTPIMPLLLSNGKAQQYAVEAGVNDFKRVETIGDIRSRRVGPKTTELFQINAKEGKKSFKKYFFGSQFIQSGLQDSRGYEDIVGRVLDEHNKQSDEIFLFGDGTSNLNVENNGLYYSSDVNYTTKASAAIPATDAHLTGLYSKLAEIIEDADDTDGQKLVLIYGATARAKWNAMFSATQKSLSSVVAEAFASVEFNKLPKSVTPTGANGFLVINLAQIKVHYTVLPSIRKQGYNDEKDYAWTNFIMGSSMVEVLAKDGIIHQPLTFA